MQPATLFLARSGEAPNAVPMVDATSRAFQKPPGGAMNGARLARPWLGNSAAGGG